LDKIWHRDYDESDSFPQALLSDPSSFLYFSDPAITPADRETYTATMTYLLTIKSAIVACEEHHWIHRRLSAMPTLAPRGFPKLLEKQDPLDIALLARFSRLMNLSMRRGGYKVLRSS